MVDGIGIVSVVGGVIGKDRDKRMRVDLNFKEKQVGELVQCCQLKNIWWKPKLVKRQQHVSLISQQSLKNMLTSRKSTSGLFITCYIDLIKNYSQAC